MNISVEGVILPNTPLSNVELEKAAMKLNIPNFRGVFVRDELPLRQRKNECGILNLDDSNGTAAGNGDVGTHWVAWWKRGDNKHYFDSYGLQPPKELISYLKSPVYYNSERIQPDGEVFCGHLCLFVLKRLSLGEDLQIIINSLYM